MGGIDAIKIGYTKRFKSRMQLTRYELRPMEEPLTLLTAFPGGRSEETLLHTRFKQDRIWREWFTLTDDLKQLIACVALNRAFVLWASLQ
jgi:hypothetical protein